MMEAMDISGMKKDFAAQMDRFMNGLDRPRILVAGATGAGKSTLANLVLGCEVCKIGSGRPVTHGIKEHSLPGVPVIVYDSEGYETGAALDKSASGDSAQAYWSLMEGFVNEHDDLMEPVDAIWYCISQPGCRVTDADLRVIRGFRELRRPLAVVLTQADVSDEETAGSLKKVIAESCGAAIPVFESSSDMSLPLERGIAELYEWTLNSLEESRRESFVIACHRDFDKKSALCKKYTALAAAAASAPGLSPVPFSDAAIITPIQLTLVGQILSVWNLMEFKNLIGAAALDVVLPMIGKTVAGNLIKLIPGAGSFIGGMLNASVAASLTYGLGMALNESFQYLSKKTLAGEIPDIREIINSDFARKAFEYARNYRSER